MAVKVKGNIILPIGLSALTTAGGMPELGPAPVLGPAPLPCNMSHIQ